MILDVALGYKSVWRILILFSEVPGKKLSREEIRKYTKMGNESITHALFILKVFGILNLYKKGKTVFYQLNLANKYTKKLLDVCQEEYKDLNAMPFDIMNSVREFSRFVLDKKFGVEKIILFGSVAKRIFRENSDVDICIIFEKKYTMKEDMIISKNAQDIGDRFGRKIQLHMFSGKEFEDLKRKKDKLVEEILRDGIEVL